MPAGYILNKRERDFVSRCLACAKIAGISGILLHMWEKMVNLTRKKSA